MNALDIQISGNADWACYMFLRNKSNKKEKNINEEIYLHHTELKWYWLSFRATLVE